MEKFLNKSFEAFRIQGFLTLEEFAKEIMEACFNESSQDFFKEVMEMFLKETLKKFLSLFWKTVRKSLSQEVPVEISEGTR